jgi:Fe(3+) dicitrate transport protein
MGKIAKHLLAFVSLSIALISASEIETSIKGSVVRQGNSAALSGANVVLTASDGQTLGTSTGENGMFYFENTPAGKYTITISFIGFQNYQSDLNIEENRTYTINAILEIQPIVMAKLEIISDANSPYESFPGAATVLDVKSLNLIDPMGTQEALELVPGINGYADDGIGNSRLSIGIRGLNPRRSSRVLILEDGVPIQPALYVYPNMYYNPPSDRIDRLEVIKGSGTIKYGPQTMGGVINYFTKRPRNEFGGKFKIKAGENGFASFFSEVGGFGSGKVKPEVQLLLKRGDGYRENNSFEQANGTLKLNYNKSADENIYLKANLNYENSNATYTGLTQYSFEENPKFNPKKDDNFKVLRTAMDLISTKRINSNLSKSSTAFISFFDRRWWRENDIFILASDVGKSNPTAQPFYGIGNLVRSGNGKDNFGILRTFYVAGAEQIYTFNTAPIGLSTLIGSSSSIEVGARLYFERFIDDKKAGAAVDSREGIYFIPAVTDEEEPIIVGQSHHYETTAFSGFVSESIELNNFTINPGLRLEVFEQERIDRLAGSIYQDKSLFAVLPGIGFTTTMAGFNIFGGIHRGFTPPSSGALKILNFGAESASAGLDLKAEESWNKEIGIRGNLYLVDFELSGFHLGIENLVAAGRGTAFKNLGKVNTMGVELNAKFNNSELNRLLPDAHLVYAFLHTEVADGVIKSNVRGTIGSDVSIKGKELPYAPTHTLTAGLSSNLNKFSYRLDFRYVSEVYTDFENIKEEDKLGIQGSVPSYSFLNFSADYDLNSSYRLFLTGKNITDQIYIGSRLHSNPGQPQANISSGILPGPRRQINLGVEYKF